MALINSDVIPVGATGGGAGYTIDQSLRFNDNDSAYLSWTPSSAGNTKTWTWSGWVKRGNVERSMLFCQYSSDTTVGFIELNSDSQLQIRDYQSGDRWHLIPSRVFRDTSSWYHIVVAVDTTQSTSTNRVKIYVNGEQETSFSTSVYPSQNQTGRININAVHYHGYRGGVDAYLDGYLAEVNFIDGQALDPSYFGETDETYGHWKPKAYSGSYGTNGFYLDFSGTYYNDKSGNGNNFTATNLATTDVSLDSPTNNFAVINPLEWYTLSGALSQGNTHWESTTSSDDNRNHSSYYPSSGKYYYEIELENLDVSSYNYTYINPAWGTYIWFVYGSQYEIYGTTGTTSISLPSDGSILQIALDCDAGKTWYGLNNTWYTTSGTPDPAAGTGAANTSYANEQWQLVVNGRGSGSTAIKLNINFGQDSSFNGNKTPQGNTDSNGIGDFYYEPPSGFLALCTSNLPEPDVIPSEHFNTLLYTGNDSTQSITGVGFQPDFGWWKKRDSVADHSLIDSVRGVTKHLVSNTSGAEQTASAGTELVSFDTDGFSLGATNVTNSLNGSGASIVSWLWKANGSGSSNTNGDITSTVSANQDAGFSIVSYSGATNATSDTSNNSGNYWTIGHGLSQAPEMIIVKKRQTADWYVTTDGIGGYGATPWADGKHCVLSTDASSANESPDGILWGNTAPTSSVFTVGGWDVVNRNGNTYIAYCFHSVEGYSKVGFYTGNGSTDGHFVYTGFRPAFVMLRSASATNAWIIKDTARNEHNVASKHLYPNLNNAEESGTGAYIDILSNGFKTRASWDGVNGSSTTYIYIAFAEQPFKYANAR